jgi:hypothetical protein
MNQGLSTSIGPLVFVQTLGLAVTLATYRLLGRGQGGLPAIGLACVGGALAAYAPFIALGTLLLTGPGRQIYSGFTSLALGVLLFAVAVLLTGRFPTAVALGPMAAFSVWTYFLLAVITSGL